MTVASPPVETPLAELLERAFEIESREESYPIAAIRGRLPDFVRGTYYLNGPALFRRGDRRLGHWLDGDGMVRALSFDGGAPRFRSRFVRSRKFCAEEEAGRFLFRTFGTAFAGDRLERGIGLASPVNVSVYPWAGRLLAFGEQGLPWELDEETLATRGEHTFGGRLNPVSPFAAHPAFDSESGEMFNFGVSFSATRPALTLYRFAADGGLVYRRRLALERPVSVHDFALSPRWALFYLSPFVLDMTTLTEGGGSLMDALRWEPRHGSRLLVVDRETGRPAASVPIGRGYCLHLIGAFEQDGTVSVDLVELDRPVYDQYRVPGLFPAPRGARPMRYVVDPGRGELVGSAALGYRRMCDFPVVDPRKAGRDHGAFWMLGISSSRHPGPKAFDELFRADWAGDLSVWRAPAGSLLGGEPVFVPDPADERGGAILCQRFDAERRASSFLLFDAWDLGAGPVAELELEHPTHLGFHATWEPAAAAATRAAGADRAA